MQILYSGIMHHPATTIYTTQIIKKKSMTILPLDSKNSFAFGARRRRSTHQIIKLNAQCAQIIRFPPSRQLLALLPQHLSQMINILLLRKRAIRVRSIVCLFLLILKCTTELLGEESRIVSYHLGRCDAPFVGSGGLCDINQFAVGARDVNILFAARVCRSGIV